MRSDTHKVLHPIAGKPLLMHLLDSVDRLGAEKSVVVVGKGRDQVEKALNGRDVLIAHQAEQKGTAHAVQQAKDALAGYEGAVLILYGDTPFVEPETLKRMLDRLDGSGGPGVVVLASTPADPLNYGRIILWQGDHIARMVEYKDATEEERSVRLVQQRHDGGSRERPVPLAATRSATTTRQANITFPTSSTSLPRKAAWRSSSRGIPTRRRG